MPRKRRVTWKGIEYESITAAAAVEGVTRDTLRMRLKRGFMDTAEMPRLKTRPWIWNGEAHDTLRKAAKANNISPSVMRYRIRKGYKGDAHMKEMQAKRKKKRRRSSPK